MRLSATLLSVLSAASLVTADYDFSIFSSTDCASGTSIAAEVGDTAEGCTTFTKAGKSAVGSTDSWDIKLYSEENCQGVSVGVVSACHTPGIFSEIWSYEVRYYKN
jgi:hypothetical protein